MSRPRKLAIGALALLLCAAPFVPRGGGDDGAITPSGDAPAARPAATAGFGAVTPEARAEIDRVLAEGRAAARVTARSTPRALAASLARCAELEGQRYCLGTGWTDRSEAEVQARVAAAADPVAARRTGRVEETGDLSTAELLRRTARLSPARRAALERAELEAAARSVAKVWLLRHEIEGVPLPAGFLDRHPEARADSTVAARGTAPVAARATTQADYPDRATIMNGKRTSEQERTYWCGPATMQMIAWAWKGRVHSQDVWASKLGTTTSGSAISEMVRVINENTGYDKASYAGPYVVLDISSYSFDKWMTLQMRHIVDYRAPVVLHPILRKSYYPYLDDDASGHFQVGRGYQKRGAKPALVSYFEPWNQQRFDPSEPYINRVQWRRAYKSFRANQAHPHQNIGV